MGGKRKRLVRILALVLAALLVLGTMASIVFSHDHAHAEAAAERDGYHLEIAFYEDAQALQIRQRLRYTNRTGGRLDRVEFSVYANMFRRVTALMYEGDVWQDVFPAGNAPGGIEFSRVLVDGEAADWGMMGEEELFLRVACDLADGEACEFTFEYTLLLTQNAASLGVGDTDWRLRGFYVQPLKYEYGEFVAPEPLQHANYVYADRADYALTLTLPERYLLAGPRRGRVFGQRRRHAHMDARGGEHPRIVRLLRHALAGIQRRDVFRHAPAPAGERSRRAGHAANGAASAGSL